MKAARSLLSAVAQQGAVGVNSIKLAANDAGSATITIAIKAGSRYQASAGVAATMAASKNLTSISHTNFLQMQQLEAAGAQFTCENTRDHLVYTLKCGPVLAPELFSDVVAPAIFENEFWQWEITDLEPVIKAQNASSDSLLDALHGVSFGSGLANTGSVPAARLGTGAFYNHDHTESTAIPYYPKPMMYNSRIGSEDLQAHHASYFNAGNITVLSSGLDASAHNNATAIVSQLAGNGPSASAGKSAFVSGEHRENTQHGAVSGYVGFPGAASGSKDCGATLILAQAMGGSSLSYEGAGLLAVPTSDPAGTVASMAGLSNDAIDQAKLECAVAHAHAATSPSGAASQNLNGTYGMDINAVTNASVKQLAGKLAKGAKSLAVKGDLAGIPFVSQL